MSWSDDINRFKKNWWKARLCRQCKFVHIGKKVDHNHCDLQYHASSKDDREDRVNGRKAPYRCLNKCPTNADISDKERG